MDKTAEHSKRIIGKSSDNDFSQINHETIFRNANDIILIFNKNGRILDVNNPGIKKYEYTLQEFKKLTIFNLQNPGEAETIGSQIKRIISKGSVKCEATHIKKSGKTFPVEISYSLIKLKNNNIIFGLIKDISIHKTIKEVPDSGERRYNILAENSPVGIFHTDAKGITTYVNPRWTEISGITAEEAYGDGWLKSVHPDDKDILLDGWKKSVRNKTISREEYRFLKKDGSIAWVIGQANPEKDNNGKIVSYVGTVTDITERKLAEISLQDSAENINALLNAPNDSILIIDANGTVINVNEITCNRLNVSKDDIIGKSIYNFLPAGTSKLRKQKMLDALKHGVIQYFEDFRNGYYFDNTVYPVKSDGNIVRLVVVAQNITERKQAEKELKLKEQQQSLILKSIPVVFYTTDCGPDLATIWISEQVKAVTGFEPERFTKDKLFWTKRINPDDIDRVISDYHSLFEKGSYNAEYRWKCSDGSYHWFSDNIVLIRDSAGKPRETIGFWVDISASKKAEEELKKQNNLLHTLIDNSPDLIYYKDNKSRFLAASNSVATFMGTTPEKLIGKTDFDFYPKELAEQYFKHEQKIIKSGKPLINCEEPRINEDGSMTCVLSTKVPLFNEKNKIIGLLGISRDITDLKRVNESLKESENKFRTVFESSRDAILLLEDGNIVDFNNRMTGIFGYTRDELIGKSPLYFSPEFQVNGISSKDLILEHITQVLNGKNVLSEIILTKKDGNPIDIEINLNKIIISGKEMLMATLHDITVRKKYEEGLKLAKEKAEETSKLKSNFLANMSHELRTPMTGILGFAEILSNSLAYEDDKHKAEVILNGGKRLMNTLNLILDLSRVEADKIDVLRKNTNVSSIAMESARLFEILAKEKNIILCTEIKDDVYAFLDEQLLEQVMSNLIKNSLLYTENGKVKVVVNTEAEDGKNKVIIKVIDTGIGIPEESIRIIFEPFRQVSEGHNRDFEGTGLGLTLAKKYIELMGGEINVRSKLNSGSEFTIKFDAVEFDIKEMKEETKEIQETSINKDNYNKNILIVEDDENSIIAIKYILSDFNTPDVTDNGKDAIALAKGKKYDLIIMDIGLKGIDGIVTTKIIRKLKGYENIPIVAVTAFVMDGDEEKFLASGCSHYIAKPYNFRETKQFILNIFKDSKNN